MCRGGVCPTRQPPVQSTPSERRSAAAGHTDTCACVNLAFVSRAGSTPGVSRYRPSWWPPSSLPVPAVQTWTGLLELGRKSAFTGGVACGLNAASEVNDVR